MSISGSAALVAFVLTLACSLVLAKRSSNWRIRLLVYAISLLPLSQCVVLLARNKVWITKEAGGIAEVLELFVSALCLATIQLLDWERSHHGKVDPRLRLIDASAHAPGQVNVQSVVRDGPASRPPAEKRKEPRFAANMPVKVTVLGTSASPAMSGRVKDMSRRGLRLTVARPVPRGSAVKVEGDDILALAEVCNCEPAASKYSLGLEVSQWMDVPVALEFYNRMWNHQDKGTDNTDPILPGVRPARVRNKPSASSSRRLLAAGRAK